MTNLIVRPIDDDRYSERSQLEYIQFMTRYRACDYQLARAKIFIKRAKRLGLYYG